jgi:CheY-like chemotaxis protein
MKPRHRLVLVIEDDTSIRELLVDLFLDAGYSVRSAGEGAEGWS